MNATEFGLLVLRVQEDDVRSHELRTFLRTLMTDPEVRRNARLVAGLADMDAKTRLQFLNANILMLLTHPALKPLASPTVAHPRLRATPEFLLRFAGVLGGTWASHFWFDDDLSRIQRLAREKKPALSSVLVGVSDELRSHLEVLCAFWGVPLSTLLQ